MDGTGGDFQSTALNDEERLMSPDQAAAFIGVSKPTLWRFRRADPNFPQPLIFGSKTVRYRKSDLLDYGRRKGRA